MTARLFAAVVPPPDVVADLDRFLEPRREADTSLRWTLAASWHITCAFLPAVADEAVDDLVEGLSAGLSGFGSFGVEVSGAGAFPDPDRARVLWLGCSRGADELARLASRCRGAANRAGITVDGAAFRPHLTLARAGGVPVTRWLRVLEALPPLGWEATQVQLIHSSALPAGAGYRTIARFPLAD
jgi:2'-5' RNA ligase